MSTPHWGSPIALVLGKDRRSWKALFRACVVKIFLAWHLDSGPVSWSNTDDSAGANALDDKIRLEKDLDAAATHWHRSCHLCHINHRASRGHVSRSICAVGVFQCHLDGIHRGGAAFFEVVVERRVHTPNKVAVTFARPNLPYSTASIHAGIHLLRIKALCTSV